MGLLDKAREALGAVKDKASETVQAAKEGAAEPYQPAPLTPQAQDPQPRVEAEGDAWQASGSFGDVVTPTDETAERLPGQLPEPGHQA